MSAKTSRFDIADLAMFITVFIWSANTVIVKAALDRIAPLPYVFSRFAIVSIVFFLWLKLRGTDLRIKRADLPRFILSGVTGFALSNLFFTFGLDHSSPFSVAVLLALGPIFTMIFAAMIGIEPIRPAQWMGALIAFIGVAIFVNARLNGFPFNWGDLYTLLSAVCFAIFTLSARPLVKDYGSPVVTAWCCLFGWIGLIPFTLQASWNQDWGRLGLGGWAALFYASVVTVLIAYTLWGWAVARRGVGKTVVFLFLEPVMTGALAVIFLSEHITATKVAGALVVLGGVQFARSPLVARAGTGFGTWRRLRKQRPSAARENVYT